MNYQNEMRYEGEWSLGLMCGSGIFKFADGRILKGQWIGDQIIEGIILDTDGHTPLLTATDEI